MQLAFGVLLFFLLFECGTDQLNDVAKPTFDWQFTVHSYKNLKDERK